MFLIFDSLRIKILSFKAKKKERTNGIARSLYI